MIRAVLAVLFFATLVVVAWWLPNWLDSPTPIAETPVDATCRPLSEICRWSTADGPAQASMTPLSGDELQLDLSLPAGRGKPLALLTGETMFMGEYPLALQALDEPGRYRARFVPPFCTTGDKMVWRVNVQVAGEPVSLPFRLLFSPAETDVDR